MSLAERDGEIIWHPYTQARIEALPIAIVRGSGCVLWDENGREYLDAISSWWVNLHGHAHPYISERIKNQLKNLHHVIFAGFTHEPAVQLAEELQKILPHGNSKIFYSDNGSTAVEAAIKMAIQYWNNIGESRTKIVALEGSYHGDTFGAMSVGAKGLFRMPFEKYLFEVSFVPAPQSEKAVSTLEEILASGDVAAFIYEPLIQGAGGMRMHEAKDLDRLLELCREAGVVAIADEVFTGFGRTGSTFAVSQLTNKPDIICLSKGLTSGTLPLAVTAARSEIYETFLSEKREKMFLHGHSYTANPLACCAALASLELTLSKNCIDQRRAIETWHSEFLPELNNNPHVSNARLKGTVLAFEVANTSQTSYLNPLRDKLYKFYIENAVILRPLGNTVYIVPPYCTTHEQMKKIYSVIMQSFELLI